MDKPKKYQVIKAKLLVDGTGAVPQENAAVVIADNMIQEIGHQDAVVIPPGAEVIDLGERTIMPGIVDAHMHFFGVPSDKLYQLPTESEPFRVLRAAGEAKKMLEAGITSARCLGSSVSPALRKAINEGHVPGPRLVVSGEFICATDGTWDHISFPLEWIKTMGMVADGVEAVREKVRERVRQGANVIKVGLSKGAIDDRYHAWGDDPYTTVASYSLEEIQSLTTEAHVNKLKVSAHCIGNEAVVNALDGGVDVIEHGYGITEETRKRVADRKVLVVTTISQLYFHEQAAEPFHYPQWERDLFERHIRAMRSDFEKGLEAGVQYALGTDLIGYPTHPQDMAAKEFELAVSWGMEPTQAIVSGTKMSAEALGMDHMIGTIEVGKMADIIGFKGNPLKDITVMQNVEFVMQDGNIIINHTI